MDEIKTLLSTLKADIEAFKTENNKRLQELNTGKADAVLLEKVDKMNAAIDKRLDLIEAAHNRSATPEMTLGNDSKVVTKAMNDYFRRGTISVEQRKSIIGCYPEEWKESNVEIKTLSVDSDPSGGYFVQPAVSSKIQQRIFETSPLRQLCGVETIGTDSWEEYSDWSENTVGWVGERQTRTETSTGDFSKLTILVHEIYCLPKLTQKMIDDPTINIEAWHSAKAARDLGREENTRFILGDGSLKPRGILTYANGTTYGTLEQVNLGAGSITASALIDLQGALKEDYQAAAVWGMRRATRTYIRKLVDGEGRYLWSLDAGINQGVQELLLGQPVRLMADVPAITSASLSVIYGDFSGYKIIDRIGIRVLRDPFTIKGCVLLYTTKRVGGGICDFDALKIGVCS